MKNHHTLPPTSRPDWLPVQRCKVCAKRMASEEEQTKVYFGGDYHAVCCPSCAAKFEACPANYILKP